MTRGRRNDSPCSVDSCIKRQWGNGLCQAHYTRLRRTGTTDLAALPTEVERFWAKVDKSQGCWVWRGGLTGNGYGTFSIRRHKTVAAHVYSYVATVGAVPTGCELDHLCRNRACVNPEHLDPVTHRVNVLRGTAPPAVNAAKTHCVRGHEFTPENTRMKGRRRLCLTCKRADERRRWHAKKAGV
jgi:hypothetical protein